MTLIQEVRLQILRERAKRVAPLAGVGLSWLTNQIAGYHAIPTRAPDPVRKRFTSGAPKKIRGHVQHALTVLAREGLVYTRRKPEGGVQRYEHGECDKYFNIRISREQALKELIKINKPYQPTRTWWNESTHMTKSLWVPNGDTR